MRAATLCGCRKVVVFGRRKYDKRSAVGAHHYIDVERVEGLVRDSSSGAPQKTHLSEEDYELCPEAFYECMSQGGYLPVFIEQCADSLVLSDENVARILRHPLVASGGGGSGPGGGLMPCFIFGNEQTGIPASIIATRARFPVSFAVELRQLGPLESFNVSSCASIVLYRVMECYLSFLPAPVQAKRNDTRAGATQDAEEAKG